MLAIIFAFFYYNYLSLEKNEAPYLNKFNLPKMVGFFSSLLDIVPVVLIMRRFLNVNEFSLFYNYTYLLFEKGVALPFVTNLNPLHPLQGHLCQPKILYLLLSDFSSVKKVNGSPIWQLPLKNTDNFPSFYFSFR